MYLRMYQNRRPNVYLVKTNILNVNFITDNKVSNVKEVQRSNSSLSSITMCFVIKTWVIINHFISNFMMYMTWSIGFLIYYTEKSYGCKEYVKKRKSLSTFSGDFPGVFFLWQHCHLVWLAPGRQIFTSLVFDVILVIFVLLN